MNEQTVEKKIRKYLLSKGWKLTNLPRTVGQHGCDITAWHPKRRKVLLIEAKGSGSVRNKHQTIHNSFYTLFGQILFRMDKEGNSQKRARIYAIAIPADWASAYKRKIKKMPYGWNLLKLRVFLANEKVVEEYSYKKFIK